MYVPREYKQVIMTRHFFEQAIARNLFPEKHVNTVLVREAVNKIGLMLPDPRESDKSFCVFHNGKNLVTLAIKENDTQFIITTALETTDWQKEAYKKFK